MKRWLVIALLLAALTVLSFRLTLELIRPGGGDLVQGAEVAVPSGQKIWFLDRSTGIGGDAGRTGEGISARFRFVAPDIGSDSADSDAISEDIMHLCQVARLVLELENKEKITQIVIGLADRETVIGSTDPDVRKFFEAFRPEGETCVPEVF